MGQELGRLRATLAPTSVRRPPGTPMTAQFQSFDDLTDPGQVAPRVAKLREELVRRGYAGFVVPRADEHQSEYVPKNAERLAWLTGFTGSAGTAIVLLDKAALVVDGRYTLQAAEQVDTALITVVRSPR